MRLYPLMLIASGALAILFSWPYLPFLTFMGAGAFGAGLVLVGIGPSANGAAQLRSTSSDRASSAD